MLGWEGGGGGRTFQDPEPFASPRWHRVPEKGLPSAFFPQDLYDLLISMASGPKNEPSPRQAGAVSSIAASPLWVPTGADLDGPAAEDPQGGETALTFGAGLDEVPSGFLFGGKMGLDGEPTLFFDKTLVAHKRAGTTQPVQEPEALFSGISGAFGQPSAASVASHEGPFLRRAITKGPESLAKVDAEQPFGGPGDVAVPAAELFFDRAQRAAAGGFGLSRDFSGRSGGRGGAPRAGGRRR
jgi:hypothetical protein